MCPNRQVIDAAFSVVRDGVQRSVFASGRVPLDRRDTTVGPVRVDKGGQTGIGALEQLVVGPHELSGFVGVLDGAR